MGDMVNNEHAVMMMKGDQKMMGMMMEKGTMMKDNPELMHGMMGEMMKDGKIMGNMMEMMKDNVHRRERHILHLRDVAYYGILQLL
jgi:hypothetical protein